MPSIDLNSPLQQAVEQMAARTVVGSPMTSREWELLPAEIRMRAMFSARVEHERTLAEMQARITDAMAGVKRDGATMDKSRFVAEMRDMIKTTGYKRPDGTRRKSVQNLRSRARLELIWEMNTAQARGYSRWLKDMETLESAPCYELIRVRQRTEVRDWPLVWRQAGGKFYGPPGKDYPGAPGRMMARMTDPIWVKISRFGVPWPPFDWGSGMGLRDVLLDEAEALGVIAGDEPPQEPQPRPFNEEASASVRGLPEEAVAGILRDFAGSVELKDGRLRIIAPAWDEAPGGRAPKLVVRQPAYTPKRHPAPPLSPKPLAATITAPKGGARRGIELAGAVHGDGVLPAVRVEITRPGNGAAGAYQPVTDNLAVPVLRVSPDAICPEWSVIHELWHMLDNLGFQLPEGTRTYASDGQPEMTPLLAAIRRTTAHGRIMRRSKEAGIGYWVTRRESLARAYTQWITTETGDPVLLANLQSILKGDQEAASVWKESQWTKPDFSPVAAGFRQLFVKLQWLDAR